MACSFFLIVFILLHSGRGGGLSDMFGGASGGALAGSTVVEKNLDRLTVVAALDLRLHDALVVASALIDARELPIKTYRPAMGNRCDPRSVRELAFREGLVTGPRDSSVRRCSPC